MNRCLMRRLPGTSCCAVLVCAAFSAAQQAAPPAERQIAARVDAEVVFADDVRRELRRVLGAREVDAEQRRLLEAKTLEQLVDRQLILAWLAGKGRAASRQDVELAVTQLEKRLAAREITLADYLQRLEFDAADLRRALHWQLSWQRFLDRYLTDENLQRYFASHRREFDGSELRVAHILLLADPQDAEMLAAAVVRAKQLRQQIVGGQISFAAAAAQHSAAPTAAAGGDIGFIGRRGPMPEAFSRAAFDLEKDAVSEPLISPSGVHLVQCLEVKPGQKSWLDVRGDLQRAVTEYLFEWAADQQRPGATIEFTGATPYFRPGTQTLAE